MSGTCRSFLSLKNKSRAVQHSLREDRTLSGGKHVSTPTSLPQIQELVIAQITERQCTGLQLWNLKSSTSLANHQNKPDKYPDMWELVLGWGIEWLNESILVSYCNWRQVNESNKNFHCENLQCHWSISLIHSAVNPDHGSLGCHNGSPAITARHHAASSATLRSTSCLSTVSRMMEPWMRNW